MLALLSMCRRPFMQGQLVTLAHMHGARQGGRLHTSCCQGNTDDFPKRAYDMGRVLRKIGGVTLIGQ